MDPSACLQLVSDAVADGDLDAAMEHLDNYRAWRAAGGFEPIWNGKPGDAAAAEMADQISDGDEVEA